MCRFMDVWMCGCVDGWVGGMEWVRSGSWVLPRVWRPGGSYQGKAEAKIRGQIRGQMAQVQEALNHFFWFAVVCWWLSCFGDDCSLMQVRFGTQYTPFLKIKLDGDVTKGLATLTELLEERRRGGLSVDHRCWSIDANAGCAHPPSVYHLTTLRATCTVLLHARPVPLWHAPIPDLAAATHPHTATHSHTQPHTATHTHTHPHTATHSHPQPQPSRWSPRVAVEFLEILRLEPFRSIVFMVCY